MRLIKLDKEAVSRMNSAGFGYVGPMLSWMLRGDKIKQEELREFEQANVDGILRRVDEGEEQGYWLVNYQSTLTSLTEAGY